MTDDPGPFSAPPGSLPPPGFPPPPSDGAGPAPAEPPSGSRAGLVIGIVVAALAVIGVGVFFLTRDDDDETVSEVTAPSFTIAVPGTDQPDLTVPDFTVPDFTIPDFTIPDFTIPDFTIPDLTVPDLTFPDISIPDISTPTELPPPTDEPDGLGDDEALNGLATDCFDGDMAACDELYDQTADDDAVAAYNRYGDTCAGRQPENTQVYCRSAFPG